MQQTGKLKTAGKRPDRIDSRVSSRPDSPAPPQIKVGLKQSDPGLEQPKLGIEQSDLEPEQS